MAYTIGDIKAILENEVDDSVSEGSLSAWVYSALVEISKLYGRVAEDSTAAVADVFYDLPADHLATILIRDSEGKEYHDYTITEYGQIAYDKDDTYTMQYFAMPEPLPTEESELLDTIPAVHELFHVSIVDWCKQKFWDKESDADSEESRFADKFKISFYQQISDAAQVLKNRSRKRSKIRMV